MSHIEVFAVRENGDVTLYTNDIHNAFGGAMHTWMALQEKYKTGSGYPTSTTHFMPLWESIGRMSTRDMWVLAATFDQFIIPMESLPMYLKHLKAFVEDYPTEQLRKLITILEQMQQDPEVHGICFNQTSGVDTWSVPVKRRGSRPYNVKRETEHTYLTQAYINKRKRKARR